MVIGGSITWDIVISIGVSIVSVLTAFFNLKNKVEQVEANVTALEDSLDEQLKLTKEVDRNFNVLMDKKVTELNVEINKVTKDLFNLKEHMQQTLVADINDLENKIAQNIEKIDNKIEANVSKYDNVIKAVENKLSDFQKQSINDFDIRVKEILKTVFKRLDEVKDSSDSVINKLVQLEINIGNVANKYEILALSLEKDKSNNLLLLDNINTIIDYIKNDLEDIKQTIRLLPNS